MRDTGTETLVALIPARGGSTRIQKKNIRPLAGHPLITYTIAAAQGSGLFGDHIYVSSDDDDILAVASYYGAKTISRPLNAAGNFSLDYEWLRHALRHIRGDGFRPSLYFLLRPTSPFRGADAIRRAWFRWSAAPEPGIRRSIRAVAIAEQNPYKMWAYNQEGWAMTPIIRPPAIYHREDRSVPPWERPTQTLQGALMQTGAIEINYTDRVLTMANKPQRITEQRIIPATMNGHEAIDINDLKDWLYAEYIAELEPGALPPITREPYETAKRGQEPRYRGDPWGAFNRPKEKGPGALTVIEEAVHA
jgi:N-acylneuraminate cytidylyltransferase